MRHGMKKEEEVLNETAEVDWLKLPTKNGAAQQKKKKYE